MYTFYDYFNTPKPVMIEPSLINDVALSSLTQTITGERINCKGNDPFSSVADRKAPMYVRHVTPNTIYYDSSCEQYEYAIYHEYGHLKTLDYNGENYTMAYREYIADKYALNLAIKKEDNKNILYAIARTIIYQNDNDLRGYNDHFESRTMLLNDKEYMKLASEYVDVDLYLYLADEFRNLSQVYGTY